jgi:hypothetical protein
MNPKALAHGLSAHATLAYLTGRDVPPLSIRQPIDHGPDLAPKSRNATEDAISLLLACAVGEMLHLGADGRHLAADREDVQRALALAGKLGDGDPVDALELVFEDLCATLKSPIIRNAVARLSGALLRAPRGEMSGDDVTREIILGLADPPPDAADQEAHPRRIYLKY